MGTEKTKRKTARCPYCTRTDIGLHPSGVRVPHTTRRNGSGEQCFGGGTKPMIEETKLSLSRNEAICTLVMLVRIAADSFSASELEETLEGGFGCLMKLGVSSAEIEAAAVYLSVMSKKEKESHE